jgi:hypothetical protein
MQQMLDMADRHNGLKVIAAVLIAGSAMAAFVLAA